MKELAVWFFCTRRILFCSFFSLRTVRMCFEGDGFEDYDCMASAFVYSLACNKPITFEWSAFSFFVVLAVFSFVVLPF